MNKCRVSACTLLFHSSYLQYGWTPLHWAAWNGHISTIHTLVAHSGCIVSITDKVSHTTSNVFTKHYFSYWDKINYISSYYFQSGSNPIHCAALNGHAGVVRVLAPIKCDVNQQRKDGWSPLHLASWNGHQDVVHELIVSRSKVNMRTDVSILYH